MKLETSAHRYRLALVNTHWIAPITSLLLMLWGCDTQTLPDAVSCTADIECLSTVPSDRRCVQSAVCLQGICALQPEPVACSSDDPCFVSTCNPASGACESELLPDSTPCDDGDACTRPGVCEAGSCISEGPVCVSDSICLDVTCSDGECINSPVQNFLPCNDGEACTESDVCIAGECTGTEITCPPDDNECTSEVCNPDSGQCESNPGNDGAACDDGDICTTDGSCADGQCIAGSPLCIDAGGSCDVGTCDTETGDCNIEPAADGTGCDDGDPCTLDDTCFEGTCEGGTPKCPDDPDACLTTICSSTGACQTVADPGNACDDDNICTTDDVCQPDGTCTGELKECTPTGLPCQARLCDPLDGQCKIFPLPEGAPCTDNDLCTTGDGCNQGDCVGSPTCIDDGNACTVQSCNTLTGDCTTTDLSDGGICDDGDPCTFQSVCVNQECSGGQPVVCPDDGDTCTVEVCVSLSGGCQSIISPDGSSCDDGDPCTGLDQCLDGGCISPGPTNCDDDGSPCTIETCVPNLGCTSTPLPDTSPCDDEDICTTSESCLSGECVGQPIACEQSNPCVNTACDPVLGCQQFPVPEGFPCDDNNLCTSNTVCNSGVCAGESAACPDDGPCTQGSCQPLTGNCLQIPQPNGTECNDGDPCTIGDSCDTGECTLSYNVDCGPALPCEQRACDPVLGCITTVLPDGSGCGGGVCGPEGTCNAGQCSSELTNCPPPNDPCALALCDPASGCTQVAAPDGTPCQSTNACTSNGVCIGGTCSGGQPVLCESDGNPCTVAECDDGIGCQQVLAPNGIDCSDGDPCTIDTTCAFGQCSGGVTLSCPSDGNDCTIDTCISGEGCTYPQADDGTPCDDNSACTGSDSCLDGVCDGSLVINCPPPSDPCLSSFCDASTGACVSGPAADNVPCNDGNSCTQFDACTGGSCIGSPISCPTPSDPCLVSVCDPASGGCQAIPAPASTACDDGSLCTVNDACDGSGGCAGVPVVCPANADNCEVGVCNTFTGACITQAAENNTPCSDGDPCTVADFCLSGQCINGPLPKCTSNDPCVAAVCTADGTCSDIPFEDGDPCDDGDLCTFGEACAAGACVGSQPITCPVGGTECAVSQCNPATGECEPTPIDEGGVCNDGDPCTEEDVCKDGSCAGIPVSCPDSGDPCSPLICHASTGFCAPTPLQNGDICNDGNFCTEATICNFGICSGETVVCTTTNDCQVASCEPTEGCTYTDAADGQACATASCFYDTTCSQGTCSGGIPVQCPPASQPCAVSSCLNDIGCTTIPLANATLCDDGNACTSDEFCTDGVCAGGGTVSCPAAGPCEVAICDPSSGCAVESVTDGTDCDDGDPCTTIDTCADGLCQSGALVQCTGSDCQPSVCDPNTGACISTLAPNGTACDDGDKCLTNTTCMDGGCTQGMPVACPDTGSDCTTSLCISATGQCEVFGVPDGTACDDQSACTTPDTCYAGVCVGQSAVTCPAASGCFVQVCDPNTGTCSPTLAEDDTPCEDGDACTTGDICLSGTCSTGSNSCCINAIDCDDSNICTNDTCAGGYCVHSPSSLTVCASDIFVSAGNNILSYTADGQLHDTALLSASFQQMTIAPSLGVMLLSGIGDPVVYEPRTQAVSPLTPAPLGAVTSATYDSNQELWIVATTEGLVYAYNAITDALIATAAAPPGVIGQSAVDENTGRVYFPTSFGYLAVLESAELSGIPGAPLPITGTPDQVYIDAPRRRLLVTDPASDGTRVVDDTYGTGLPGDTLSGLGAPSQLALDPAGDRLYATYNEGGVVRGYSLSTLLPLTPPAVAISAPSRVSVDATNLFVLTSSGELHFMDAATFTALFPPLGVPGATDLQVYRPHRPPVIINEVSTGDSGWIELLVTSTALVDFSGVQLQGNGGSVDLTGLGALAPGSLILACHPNAPVIADCVVTSPIVQPEFGDSWTLMNGSRVWDQYKTSSTSPITGRVHPAIDGRRPEAIANTSGTPNAPNDDITLD